MEISNAQRASILVHALPYIQKYAKHSNVAPCVLCEPKCGSEWQMIHR